MTCKERLRIREEASQAQKVWQVGIENSGAFAVRIEAQGCHLEKYNHQKKKSSKLRIATLVVEASTLSGKEMRHLKLRSPTDTVPQTPATRPGMR